MNNSNSGFWALAFGVAAGGAAVYFLNTKKGQDMAKIAKKEYQKLEKQARKTLEEGSDMVADKATKALETSKRWASDASATAQDKVNAFSNKAENLVEDAKHKFEKGADTLERKIS